MSLVESKMAASFSVTALKRQDGVGERLIQKNIDSDWKNFPEYSEPGLKIYS